MSFAALCTVFETRSLCSCTCSKRREKHPIKISVEIDGAPISVEAADLEGCRGCVEAGKTLPCGTPTVKVTPQSKIKAKVRVS